MIHINLYGMMYDGYMDGNMDVSIQYMMKYGNIVPIYIPLIARKIGNGLVIGRYRKIYVGLPVGLAHWLGCS